jgi:hypothetical protein
MSSSNSFIKEGNVFIVPTLRNRLVFAAQVQNALRDLSDAAPWDGTKDAICVSLPWSLKSALTSAISRLPKARVILANDSESTAREVLPVTPADAFIEAVRSADDLSSHVEFIDIEILPGNLMQNPCQRFPDWLDDSLIDAVGIESYLSKVAGLLALPPFRAEPIDTWREAHILQRLRDLQPLWRRLLFVCDMSLVTNLRSALQREYSGPTAGPTQSQAVDFKLQDYGTLTVLLNVLDDYPKLVELFHERRGPHAPRFDKREILIDEICSYLSKLKDVTISTRQLQIFSTFLNNVLLIRGRRSPEPRILFQVAEACFGKAVAERLHCHLASYGRQIEVERVRPRPLENLGSFRYKLDVESAGRGYRSRECSPFAPPYDIERRTKGPLKPDEKSKEFEWAPTVLFLREMHKKILNISRSVRNKPIIRPFAGSIERGIETRATLRSMFTRRPKLFVRGMGRVHESVNVEHEPVLWILDTNFETDGWGVQSAHFRAVMDDPVVGGRQDGLSFYISEQEILEIPEGLDDITMYRDSDEDVSILGPRRLCWLTFGLQYATESQARGSYGADFEQRVPNHQEFDHPRDYGCIHKVFAEQVAEEDLSWLGVAVLTAFKYAKHAVVVVIPNGVTIPPALLEHPLCRGKRALYISLGKFSQSEQDKLRTHYRIIDDSGRTNPEVYRDALMRRFWI